MIKNRCGFTLTEILIVLVVLGVIAGLAVPTYFNTVEQGRSNEARVNLNIIYMGEKIYAINDPGKNYWNGGLNPALATINSTLNVDIVTKYYDITSITAVGSASFSAVARRNAAQGGNGTTSYTIDQTGTIT